MTKLINCDQSDSPDQWFVTKWTSQSEQSKTKYFILFSDSDSKYTYLATIRGLIWRKVYSKIKENWAKA